jgi:hypothetical protein
MRATHKPYRQPLETPLAKICVELSAAGTGAREFAPMQEAMTLNVQGAAGTPWPDPTTQAVSQAAQPQPQPTPHAPPTHHHQLQHDTFTVAPAQPEPNGYEAMRLQAYKRDAAETSGLTTQTAPDTPNTSTSVAPAVRTAPVPAVNLAIQAPDAPPPPTTEQEETPAIQAVEALASA